MIYENVELSGSLNISGSFQVPYGVSGSEPTSPSYGSLFFNTTDERLYVWEGSWEIVGTQVQPLPSADIEYLVVAGGGGGNANSGGGAAGGAGGLLSSSLSTVESGSSFTITVGAGGSAYTGEGGPAGEGGDSSIAGTSITTITAIGGGGAGDYYSLNGHDGGSGGGATNSNGQADGTGGSGTAGQGFDGGDSFAVAVNNNNNAAGGGGGAGEAGADAASGVGGDGGDGKQSSITGTATYYAGGGGGGCRGDLVEGTGGLGGGGNGGYLYGQNGTANTGGGAGGSRSTPAAVGGSGVVILAYDSGSINAAGGIVGDAGNGRKYHQFNESGTFKVGSTSDLEVISDNLYIHLDAGNFSSRGTSTWTDLTSTGYNATLVSSPSLGQNFYYDFDGSADYGTFSSTAATDLQADTQGTIEVWVYGDSFTSGTGRKTIFGTGHSSNTARWVVLRVHQTNGIQMSVWDGTTTRDFKTGVLPSTGTWLHIVASATSDGTGKIYLNGVSQSITYANGSAGDGSSRWFSHSDTDTLQVGALDRGTSGNNYDPWDGRIAQVRYYTDVLTDAEVLQNYNATKTNFV